ncbi:MAG: response regulator transcription factor [Candidatus Eremiobacteraeota bacterium]|nr:response regulator transcription factor [Candidatus Eremiobacteraeota bacterium]
MAIYAQPEHALALLQQRRTPKFFIADANGAAMYCASELTGSPLLARSRHVLEALLERDGEIRGLTFEQLDADVMLRIVPLAGSEAACYAVFLEPVKSRNSVGSAVKRYDVSRRESEVLELLVAGLTTAQIAERLCISEGTVGDHVKSLFRKTRTNKRSELVARVFRGPHL